MVSDGVDSTTAGTAVSATGGTTGSTTGGTIGSSGTGTGSNRVAWVIMKQQPLLAVAAATKDWKVRGQNVFGVLTNNANVSQASLLAYLAQNNIKNHPFWIVNAIRIEASQTVIDAIARRADVDRVVGDATYAIPPIQKGTASQHIQGAEWGITNIHAPEAWATYSARGDGIVVASVDTGVQFDHPALARQYRGAQSNGSYDHNYNWFDPAFICGRGGSAPCDNVGHGTHTMGTMVGDDGDPGQNQIGVAPHARWIAAKGCEYDSCTSESLLAAAQWILAPTDLSGNNPRPELRPNVVNNSWGGQSGDTFYQAAVQAWVAAGIFPAFSAGNSGMSCSSVGSPGDYPESYASGAYDTGNIIATFSSRGPSMFGLVKPNIAAPGVNVRSSVPGSSYDWYSGTSMASPHLAGTVALMWSAAPSLVGDVAGTRAVLDESAVDTSDVSCGGTSKNNNVWGEGHLDALAAVDLSPRGPTGTLQGAVTRAGDGTPIAGASVLIQGGVRDQTKVTDASGAYFARLGIGTYQVTAGAFGFIAQTVAGVQVSQDVVVTQNYALLPAPVHALAGTVRDDHGNPLGGVQVTVLSTPVLPVVTDSSGHYSIPSLPDGTYQVQARGTPCYAGQTQPLTLSKDDTLDFTLPQRMDGFGYSCLPVPYAFVEANTIVPISSMTGKADVTLPFPVTFYGQTYETATVTEYGYLNFGSSATVVASNVQVPSPSLPNGAIYPFWTTMYLDAQSSVRTELAGAAPDRQFVIEWRDMVSWTSSSRARFEIVLNESGPITLQYATANDPWQQGNAATIGLENESGTVGFDYSFDQPVLTPETAVRFSLPPSGTIEGTLADANDGSPIGGVTVQAVQGSTVVRSTKTTAHGFYRLQVPAGSYDIVVGKDDYGKQQVTLTVAMGQRLTQNFALPTAKAALTPGTLQLLLPINQTRTRSFSLQNSGSRDLVFTVAEAGGTKQTVTATRQYARKAAFDANARTTKGLFQDGVTPMGWSANATGSVLKSFVPQGMQLAWGVGTMSDLWLSDAMVPNNVEFTEDGTLTGRHWPPTWTSGWAADMAYDSAHNQMCQVAVGGDNGIYCWDPSTGAVTGSIMGSLPWTATSQRGLAYRPDDDSFYVGGWNEGVIYHIKGLSAPDKGAVLSTCAAPDGAISGLAYNSSLKVLWQATNSGTDTIYELNPDDCTVLSTLAPPASGGYQGGGLEMDGLGNLWMIAQSPNKVYLVDSGVPAFTDVPWLTVKPTTGTVAPGKSGSLAVTVSTTGLTPGVYLASVFVLTDAAKQTILRIPVSLIVSAYQQGVNAGGNSYTDGSGDAWAVDQKYKTGSWGYTDKSSTTSTRKAIGGTTDPLLYQSQRIAPYAYRFDNVPNGVYQVEFKFAELDAKMKNGKRMFDVIVENSLVLPAHDIAYDVGTLVADNHTFFIEVADGRMDVRFIARAGSDNPVINALRITHRPDR
jgi:subtilisin family serine protease